MHLLYNGPTYMPGEPMVEGCRRWCYRMLKMKVILPAGRIYGDHGPRAYMLDQGANTSTKLITGLHIQKAYTSLVLPLCISHCCLLMHVCILPEKILQLDTQCVHLVYAFRTNCNQNTYGLRQPW